MRKISLLSIFIFLSIVCVNAQKKELTLKQAVLGQRSEFGAQTLRNLSWIPEMPSYTYVKDNALVQNDCKTQKQSTILTLDDLNSIVVSKGLTALKNFPGIVWVSKSTIRFSVDSNVVIFDIKQKTILSVVAYDKDGENREISPDNQKVAYTIANNLLIANKDGKVMQVTNDSNPGIVNGKSVHRNEFGINGGIFWSPKSNYLAFYRMDETMVTDYPLVDITTRIATVSNTKYPMAGMKSHEVTLGVYNLQNGQTTFLKTGEPKEQFLTSIAWSPDEKSIFIGVLNREQNHLKMNQYNAQTGDFVKTLFEEKSDKYVEPQEPIEFLNTNPSQFIWLSKRDGWNHVYLYNIDGTLVKQLTKGNWDITRVIGFDKQDKKFYYLSTQQSPIEKHLYCLDVKKGTELKLTSIGGTHYPIVSKDQDYFIDVFSSTEIPNQIDLYTLKGKLVNNILKAENPYKDYNMSNLEMVKLKTHDGKYDLYARIIKPADFDPAKKYPVVVYVYGGPHSQLVTNDWLGGARLWEYYMANKGYIMFTLDNRGTSNRGFDFENVIHRNLSVNEIDDQMVGVEYLKSLSFVDVNRIGVHGWSYGGFMTVSMMLKKADVFKVGVAGGPVIDWKYYEIMYGERYMDMPDENPEGYKNADLKNFVSNLKGRLLIIHDDMDNTVVPQNSLTFLHECIKNNVQVDFFLYPQHEHNVAGKDRIHLIDKIIRYFDEHL
ncbi:MAG TPA: S9 family peptidase [Bacteroidales bacterium]|nr:S9 family peptidase [Bacteroidales bacterium]